MNAPRTLNVGAVLFEGFELLDLFGPLEMFGLLGDAAHLTMIASAAGKVASSCGPRAVAETEMADCNGFDVLLIPGGIGTRKVMKDPCFLSDLMRISESSETVATVCTGSLLLAMTGLLDGRKATTNKRVFREVAFHAPRVDWIAKARWVEDGKYLTSSGISAGMDMTLALIAKRFGRETSVEIARRAEYLWQEDGASDPFAVPDETVT